MSAGLPAGEDRESLEGSDGPMPTGRVKNSDRWL